MGFLSFFTGAKTQTVPKKTEKRMFRAPRADHLKGGFVPRNSWERVPSALGTIQARARDLVDNNPYASRAISILSSYIVGSGIRIAVTGNPEYSAEFRDWANSTAVDYDGRLNLYGKQNLAVRMMMGAGEAFEIIRHVEDANGRVRPQFQSIDPSLVANTAMPKYPGNVVVAGVEISRQDGRVIGYHFYESADPMMSGTKTFFVAARDVMHLFETLYPGQLRGVPRGSQALIPADDVDNFVSTMLVKARTEACLTVFVKTAAGDEYADVGEVDETVSDPIPEDLRPGAIIRMGEGDEIQSINPSSSGGFLDYIKVSLQAVAISYRVTYSLLSGDLANVSFSSLKSDRDLFFQGCQETREIWVFPFVSRMERLFREDYELTTGKDVRVQTTIVPPARAQIDPQKETAAQIARMQSGLTSWSDEVLASGKDPAEHLEQIIAERKAIGNAKIVFSFIPPVIEADPEEEAEEQAEKDAEANRDPAEDDEA